MYCLYEHAVLMRLVIQSPAKEYVYATEGGKLTNQGRHHTFKKGQC